jgi:hypothetical protein
MFCNLTWPRYFQAHATQARFGQYLFLGATAPNVKHHIQMNLNVYKATLAENNGTGAQWNQSRNKD